MHECIQFYIVLKVCPFARTLAGHSPALQVFAHVAGRDGDAVPFLDQLAYGRTCPEHEAQLYLVGRLVNKDVADFLFLCGCKLAFFPQLSATLLLPQASGVLLFVRTGNSVYCLKRDVERVGNFFMFHMLF